MKYLFIAMRPKQWIKNTLILLPLVFGKRLFNLMVGLKTLEAFIIFSFAAGAVYILNDIVDIEKDASHPTKRLRPIVSGKVSIKQAWAAVCILCALSIAASFLLNTHFGWIIISYYVLNVIYTKFLKNMVITDILCIASFYLIRIIAGIVIAEVKTSIWIISITVLLAILIGLIKRRQEFISLKDKAVLHRSVLGKYNLHFTDWIIAIITILIMLIYPLYSIFPSTVEKFGTTHMIFSAPFVYCGIIRYLYLTYRFNKELDLANLIFSDRIMQLNIIMWLISCISVIYFKF